jgi:cell division protein FtsI/penicillin-binding protein 2
MRLRRPERQFPERVNRVLNFILGSLCLLVVRSWHLAVVQHDDRVAEAERPKRKTVWVTPQRGPIVDRFGEPLATNAEEFRVGVLYAAVRDIPRVAALLRDGKRMRVRARSEYITALAGRLGQELQMDPLRIEDLIHSQAALFPHVPCVLKDRLTEEQYHRLKLLERDWPGLVVEVASRRHYPAGPSLAHVVGYLGRMTGEEYREWRGVQALLDAADGGDPYALLEAADLGILPDAISAKRLEWRRRGYVPSDWTGKTGIEKSCENRLRGLCGLDQFEADTSGRRLRSLGTELPVDSGETITLSISLELQREAERLLQEAESRSTVARAPAQLGGGIVALDPNTGEVLCMATTPSFDPNAFVDQSPEVLSYLENERWIGRVWDGLAPLAHGAPRARGHEAVQAGQQHLTWEVYLDRVLGKDHPASQVAQQIDLGSARQALIQIGDQGAPSDEVLDQLSEIVPCWPVQRTHRLLCLDLMRLALGLDASNSSSASQRQNTRSVPELPDWSLNWRLGAWRSLQQDVLRVMQSLKEASKVAFHDRVFLPWRQNHQKRWLARERQNEKRANRPHRPYLELLDREEARQFDGWWEQNGADLLAAVVQGAHSPFVVGEEQLHGQGLQALLRLRKVAQNYPGESIQWRALGCSFEDLQAPLIGHYPYLRSRRNQKLRDLASAFLPPTGFGVMRSHAFQQIAPLGSVFKLVTAAEALRQSEIKHGRAQSDSWTIVENAVQEGSRITQVGKTADGRTIPRVYLGGRLPLTAYRHFGKMDLLSAIERSSNPYFALLTVEAMRSPLDLLEAAQICGFGARTQIGLAGESPGRLPDDLEYNRSGLYAFSIGQHEMRCTPLQAATLLAGLANGGELLKPTVIAGERREVRSQLPFSADIRRTLLQGMYRVVHGPTGSARLAAVRRDQCSPSLKAAYQRVAPCLIGKTGTAQILETLSPDPEGGVQMVQHVWFGGVLYPDPQKAEEQRDPELVIVVFLRFANGGREGAPLAARIAERWREIRAQNQPSSSKAIGSGG